MAKRIIKIATLIVAFCTGLFLMYQAVKWMFYMQQTHMLTGAVCNFSLLFTIGMLFLCLSMSEKKKTGESEIGVTLFAILSLIVAVIIGIYLCFTEERIQFITLASLLIPGAILVFLPWVYKPEK